VTKLLVSQNELSLICFRIYFLNVLWFVVDGVSGDVYQPKKSPLMSSTSPFYVPALS